MLSVRVIPCAMASSMKAKTGATNDNTLSSRYRDDDSDNDIDDDDNESDNDSDDDMIDDDNESDESDDIVERIEPGITGIYEGLPMRDGEVDIAQLACIIRHSSSIVISLSPSIYLPIYPSMYQSIYLSIYPSIYLSIHLCIYPSIYLSIHTCMKVRNF